MKAGFIALAAIALFLIVYHRRQASQLRRKSFLFSVEDFPPIALLNKRLLSDFQRVRREALSLEGKPISKIVIGKGDIYDPQKGPKLLERVKEQDSWTVGWDSGSGVDNWKQYPIIYKGEMLENARKTLPFICSLVDPIKDRFYTLFVSVIKPHGEIEQHCDGGDKANLVGKDRLTYHFNLDCPPTCVLNVEDHYVVQRDRGNIVFDSAYQHGVKNSSRFPRTILCGKFYISKCRKETSFS
jgi:hypothetical protein